MKHERGKFIKSDSSTFERDFYQNSINSIGKYRWADCILKQLKKY